jgi:2-methylcitrate dehydratase PrpD
VNRTERISRYIADATATPLDDAVARRASLHLLDTLASIVACRDLEPAVVARRYVGTRSPAPGGGDGRSATVLGTSQRASVVDAVFAGAMTGHAAEINDFVPSVFVQPGPAVIATAIGVGEATGASGADVLRAVVAGYELCVRVLQAVGTANLRRTGLASHGVGPCFGSAATAAALLGLPAPSVAQVLSLAAQQAAGSWQWLLDEEHVEKAFVFAGLGARNGVDAALLVEAGFRGVTDVVDRPGTWFTSPVLADVDGDGDLDRLVDGLGETSVFPLVACKRYPVGGPTQPAVEALLDLSAAGVEAVEVDHVLVEMPGRWEAFRDAAMPALNLPYLAALILLEGGLDFTAAQSRDRLREDAAVHAVMGRVEVRHDPAQEAGPGEERTESARVRVTLRDGSTHERFVPHVAGFPSHPLSAGEVEAKAIALVEPHLGGSGAAALVEACRHPDRLDASAFAALVAR